MDALGDIRKQYAQGTLELSALPETPVPFFKEWLAQAIEADVLEANAMSLSTSIEGKPSTRIVLIKEITDTGIVFYTSYESRKSKEIQANPNVSICFLWKEIERQVRLEGVASKISKERSEKYFQSRPRASQISAWASPQSEVVMNRDYLMELRDKVETRFEEIDPLPCPDHWGGFEIKINRAEFWQGRPDRYHDRFAYTLDGDQWNLERLGP